MNSPRAYRASTISLDSHDDYYFASWVHEGRHVLVGSPFTSVNVATLRMFVALSPTCSLGCNVYVALLWIPVPRLCSRSCCPMQWSAHIQPSHRCRRANQKYRIKFLCTISTYILCLSGCTGCCVVGCCGIDQFVSMSMFAATHYDVIATV